MPLGFSNGRHKSDFRIRTPLVKIYHVKKFRRGKMSCSVGKYKFTVCHLESALTFYNDTLNKTQNARQGFSMLRFRLSGPRPKDKHFPKVKLLAFQSTSMLLIYIYGNCEPVCAIVNKKNVQKGSINLKKKLAASLPCWLFYTSLSVSTSL